jgi:hypothetical protein
MAKPLVVYFHPVPYFNHSRRVYIAARSKAAAARISGISVGQLGYGQFQVAGFAKGEKGAWTPLWITQDSEEACWLEIRDHDEEGHLKADENSDYGGADFRHHTKKVERPENEAAFIRCPTLAACKELFTLKLDRALAAAGIPSEAL